MCFGDILLLLVSGFLQKQISWLDTGPFVYNQRVSLVMEISLISDVSEDLIREEEFLLCLVIPGKDHIFTLKSVILSHSQSSF